MVNVAFIENGKYWHLFSSLFGQNYTWQLIKFYLSTNIYNIALIFGPAFFGTSFKYQFIYLLKYIKSQLTLIHVQLLLVSIYAFSVYFYMHSTK